MKKAEELRIEEFNNWVAERIAVLETCYENQKAPLDYRLTRKEPVHKASSKTASKVLIPLSMRKLQLQNS